MFDKAAEFATSCKGTIAATRLCNMFGREEWTEEGEAKEFVRDGGWGELGGGNGYERGRGGRSEGGAC